MSLRKGIVVDVHPEDHSVDLVMADDGSHLVGVPVLAGPGASARTGSVDLPDIPARQDKWDVTKRTGQDVEAMVGAFGRNPVVVGFLFPQINQVLPKAAGVRVSRHRSDVVQTIDQSGNMQISWPNGTYLRVGESPDQATIPTADSSAIDRNTGSRMHVRLGLAGGAFTLTITPDGQCTMEMQQGMTINATGSITVQSSGSATVKGSSVTIDAPNTHITGSVTVDGDVVATGVSLVNHLHGGVTPGPGPTGKPIPS